jgi:hypothetical protein
MIQLCRDAGRTLRPFFYDQKSNVFGIVLSARQRSDIHFQVLSASLLHNKPKKGPGRNGVCGRPKNVSYGETHSGYVKNRGK